MSITTALTNIGLREKDGAKPALQSPVALVAGTLGGAFAGAMMGKPSLYSGLATTIIGVIAKVPLVTSFGAGMMISGGYSVGSSVNGFGGTTLKERIIAFGQDFKERLYLDKIIKPKDELPIAGLGNVQYFKYPLNGSADLDMSALDNVHKDIVLSAMNFQQSQLRGTYNAGDSLM